MMRVSDRHCHYGIVILNGGEAAVKDRTSTERFDGVDGNAHGACGVQGPSLPTAALTFRKVPRKAIAFLRMTCTTVCPKECHPRVERVSPRIFMKLCAMHCVLLSARAELCTATIAEE